MGFYKNKIIEFNDRGYRDSEKNICAAHFSDDYIISKIKYSHHRGKCSFCKKTRNVVPFNDILEIINKVISRDYLFAIDDAEYDSESKDYIDHIIDPYDFVYDELNSFLGIEDDEVLEELFDKLEFEDRISVYTFTERLEKIDMNRWNEYCDLVKKVTFSAELIVSLSQKPSNVLPKNLLEIHKTLNMVWEHCKEMFLVKTKFGLSSQYFPNGYYRCVKYLPKFNNECPEYAGLDYIPAMMVGTAPAKLVADNRMSEAGDMMFYGADDKETAMIECECKEGDLATIGFFISNKKFTILDLSNIDDWKRPSIFDITNSNKRSSWYFLREFMNNISKSRYTDSKDENFYKPTQVFTKFIQRKTSVQGIKFRSSKNQKGCYVLFVVDRDCLDSNDKTNPKRNQLIMKNVAQHIYHEELK